MQELTPAAIVAALDRHIVGQAAAKRALAVALRNRWRRLQLEPNLQQEITPKNMLMIGPTGVGKTELARRMARLVEAPFIKVEATKFTEVGYVGRDVESIIRDLMTIAIKQAQQQAERDMATTCQQKVEAKLLFALTGQEPQTAEPSASYRLFQQQLRDGKLEHKEIELQLEQTTVGLEIMSPPGMEEMVHQIQHLVEHLTHKPSKKKRLTVAEARKKLTEEIRSQLLDREAIQAQALAHVEQRGIVFIDEIDKICGYSAASSSGEVSREGVQRDLLPLVEGCTVQTKQGWVKTDHILFIASGAFHASKPADLIPELQGRFPIRVELDPLSIEDLWHILTEPKPSLLEQATALLAADGVKLRWQKAAVRQLAQRAYELNKTVANIGARRLHTMLERLLENIAFEADYQHPKTIMVTTAMVERELDTLCTHQDLQQHVL